MNPASLAWAQGVALEYARRRALEGHQRADAWLVRRLAQLHADREALRAELDLIQFPTQE